MSDARITTADKPVVNPEVHASLSAAADVPPGSSPPPARASNDAHVHAGTLPALSIDGADSNNSHWGSGAMAVAKDLGEGAYNQVTQHTGQVAESGAIGLAIGAAATTVADGAVVAAAAVGLTLTAPEVLIGAAVLGAGYGLYELGEHVGGWLDAAKVVSDQKDHSAAEVAQAHTELQGVGAGGVDVAAGIGGAVAGSYIAGALAAASADAPATTTPSLDSPPAVPPRGDVAPGDAPPTVAPAAATAPIDAPATPATTGTTPPGGDAPASAAPPATTPPGGDAPAHAAPTAAIPPGGDAPAHAAPTAAIPPGGDAPATTAQTTATPPTDASATTAKPGDAPEQAPAMTPEEQAIANSIKANQAVFNAADQDNPIIPTVKQDYNVRFQKVTEPTPIQSLENLKTGTTEIAQPGQWIATRLNPDGTPNIENGITNSWPIAEKTILKSYQATPADLQSGDLVAATRTDAPPVQMIQLTAPLTIRTSWGGETSGEPGDWLVNYDYENNQPGVDFNIVTAASYKQTYEPLAAA